MVTVSMNFSKTAHPRHCLEISSHGSAVAHSCCKASASLAEVGSGTLRALLYPACHYKRSASCWLLTLDHHYNDDVGSGV